jgi:hypothetical protein
VLLKAAKPYRGWEAVDVESTPSLASDAPFGGVLIRAIPHTGEDWKRSLVFAHALVNGSRETVLLMAERDMRKAETAYTSAPVRVSAFALRADPDTGQDHFVLIRQSWAAKCYVDAGWALIEAFKLSAPADYEGDRDATACKAPPS